MKKLNIHLFCNIQRRKFVHIYNNFKHMLNLKRKNFVLLESAKLVLIIFNKEPKALPPLAYKHDIEFDV